MNVPHDLVTRTPTQYSFPEGLLVCSLKHRLGDRVITALGSSGTIIGIKVEAFVDYDASVSLRPCYLVRLDEDVEDTWVTEDALQ